MQPGRVAEKYYPWALGVVAGLAGWLLRAHIPAFETNSQQLFASSVDLGAIAVGFLATAKGLLLSFEGTRAGRFIRDSGLLSTLAEYLRVATWVAFGFALLSLLIVGIIGTCKTMPPALGIFWFALAVVAGSSVFRATQIFFRVFKTKVKEPSS